MNTTTVTVTGLGAISLPTSSNRQHLSTTSNSARYCSVVGHTQNFSVDTLTYQHVIDRRKGFRNRGSLGPTVLSAPSFEQEDYRTRPSIPAIQIGKSFDLDRAKNKLAASDSNGLIKISADVCRLAGSRQRYKNLLTARKRLGQMPPAFTQIDYSHDSFESSKSGKAPNGPVMITVEDTASMGQARVTSCNESQRSSLDDRNQMVTIASGENGGLLGSPSNAHVELNRNNIPIDGNAVKMVYNMRSQRLKSRVSISDRCLFLAFIGCMLSVLDLELRYQNAFGIVAKDHPISLSLRTLVMFSTFGLLIEIVHFHVNELLLDLVDCGADDWRVVFTWRRTWHFLLEFVICAISPLPGTSTVSWTFVDAKNRGHMSSMASILRPVPTDVVLSLLMIGRIYLFCRFIVLHSNHFKDASTRTLAALNRIQVNFTFVMKTVLDQRPMLFLSIFLLGFWLISAWTFVQSEREGRDEEWSVLYSNAFWFIAATFNGNGYGDVVPKTIAGRLIGIIVGVIGCIVSSILIAVISRSIVLTTGQLRVNNFICETRLSQELKHAAARVLQKTWKIYRCQHESNAPDHLLRKHQRKFLNAIYDFRHVKNKMRAFSENNDGSFQQLSRLMSEMKSSMDKMTVAQEEMRAQIEVLQRAMRNHRTYSTPQNLPTNFTDPNDCDC
ncbi:hypothetical protein M3Y96_00239100 [Aphelenchoides besseyi]|nr:hypothetical protein M3Y96_00239100 [Aphelenchoides besseyi]